LTSRVDLNDGGIESQDANLNLMVEKYANDWWRIQLSFDAESGVTTPSVTIFLYNGSETYQGDGSSGLHAWGLQIEVDERFPSSYMGDTGSGTLTRQADDLVLPFEHTVGPITALADFVDIGESLFADNTAYIFHVGHETNTTDPRFLLRKGSTTIMEALADSGTTTQTKASPTSISLGDVVEIRQTLDPNGDLQIHDSINGAAELSSTETAGFDFDEAGDEWGGSGGEKLLVGHYSNDANFGLFLLRSLKFYRGVQTLATMRQLT
jgi:hypothetical protein